MRALEFSPADSRSLARKRGICSRGCARAGMVLAVRACSQFVRVQGGSRPLTGRAASQGDLCLRCSLSKQQHLSAAAIGWHQAGARGGELGSSAPRVRQGPCVVTTVAQGLCFRPVLSRLRIRVPQRTDTPRSNVVRIGS